MSICQTELKVTRLKISLPKPWFMGGISRWIISHRSYDDREVTRLFASAIHLHAWMHELINKLNRRFSSLEFLLFLKVIYRSEISKILFFKSIEMIFLITQVPTHYTSLIDAIRVHLRVMCGSWAAKSQLPRCLVTPYNWVLVAQ